MDVWLEIPTPTVANLLRSLIADAYAAADPSRARSIVFSNSGIAGLVSNERGHSAARALGTGHGEVMNPPGALRGGNLHVQRYRSGDWSMIPLYL